ncbi:MAG: TrkH family potassium uptake protein [Lachnospiraceae bacterium]|nr:TrkH family potassium uptake protein [Lachnospiraceae bacterium]
MNYRSISYFVGWVLKIEALSMAVPMILSLFFGDGVWPYFLVGIAAAAGLGFLMSPKSFKNNTFFVREGYVATAIAWLMISVIGALPFFLSGRIPDFVDALFETASGFTTTGSSILNDVEHLGKSLLFWRSFIHYFGGMGVLVLVLAILPVDGGYHMQLMKAESPGHSVSKFVPRVSDTAKVLYLIYTGMTFAAILTYIICGMPIFDAFCIGFGTAGTGGFAVRNAGMMEYNNASLVAITVWMTMFGVNFNVYYLFFRKKIRDGLRSEEARVYLCIVFAAIVIVTTTLVVSKCGVGNFGEDLIHSGFTVASVVTSTGFSTLDFELWPNTLKFFLLFLMFIGACGGSTGGGFKVSRVVILFKEAKNELHLLIHPQSVKAVRFEGKAVEKSVVRSVNAYFVIYVMVFVISFFVISLDGYDFGTNFSAVLATLNNIGPGIGKVGPAANYSVFSTASKLMLTFNMIAGRLELLPMLLLLYPKTWTGRD